MSNIWRIGLLCSLLLGTSPAWAKTQTYQLVISETAPSRNSSQAHIVVNGQSPAPTLYFTEGDDAVITVHNQLKNSSSIHWHGILLPGNMDGVSGLNGFVSIPAGGQFTYRFPIRQSGSYWYHAHSNAQEQDGLYGGIVIRPKTEAVTADVDAVLLITDAHPKRGAAIFKRLKQDAEFYNHTRLNAANYAEQIQQQGFKRTLSNAMMWGKMRMRATDLADISNYQFLINGQSAAAPWRLNFQAGQTFRLRIINSSAMSIFDVRIANLKMTIVAADGQPVKPVEVDEFRFGVAESYDVLLQPQAGQDYAIVAESIDRQGYALGVLQDQQQPLTIVPKPTTRPISLLSMADMGHEPHGSVTAQHDHSAAPLTHAVHAQPKADGSSATPEASTHTQHLSHAPKASEMASAMPASENPLSGWRNASTPKGLKALHYSDLQFLGLQPDVRPASRSIDIQLSGNMTRYIWTLNGKTYPDTTPIHVQHGERIRLNFINNSMMAHPMHLHGLFMQLDNGQDPAKMPNKHTVLVPPAETVSVLVTANETGRWLLHCHLLYHMMAGMMTELDIAAPDASAKAVLPKSSSAPSHSQHQAMPAMAEMPQMEHHHAH